MSGDDNEERQARSLALEKAYVHDVYDQIAPHFTDTRYRPWPRVKQFLLELEPGSLVADVGCGNGKYLDINPDLMKIGSDRCSSLTASARARNFEVLTCDNLRMPFRDETFDAVLSIAVIHHFATTDRRVAAIKELTRVLRIGGKVLITVWAMEQRHRKFDSQDVLVPWHEPVKSSSEDRGSSVERELTSTTTSDDDVLVYHAYSHISDSEKQQHPVVSRKRQKYRNGRGRYRSADSALHCRRTTGNSSQSSSELSSPNETCYSFVRRAFQKLSNSTPEASPYDTLAKKSAPYFYRSCRKPCVSESMEFGKDSALGSPRNEFCQQDSLDSEYPDDEDDIPIELRALEGYETCKKCGSPTTEFGFGNCEQRVCTSCLPSDPDTGKKSRTLGDFLNMIPKLLRVKKCEKEPLSDLHKRISTASDPREYVAKTRGGDLNGIVRSKSTVSMMSRLEELMSMSPTSGKDEQHSVANPNCPAGPRSKTKPALLPSFASTVLVEGQNGNVKIRGADGIRNPRRYNSPADALKKLRQDVALDEPYDMDVTKVCNGQQKDANSCGEKKLQNSDSTTRRKKSSLKIVNGPCKENVQKIESDGDAANGNSPPDPPDGTEMKTEEPNDTEAHLSSYYSMPELYKLTHDQIPEEPILNSQKQRHISFYEQAQNIFADTTSDSNDLSSRRHDSTLNYAARERATSSGQTQRGLVKRSLSVDTGDNSSSSHQTPRRFSASAAQGVLASALRTYSLPRSCSRGSSVKSDTSVDSEESIVSVIPRKGNSITSDTSVDSEESVISVIQRSTSEIDTLSCQNGLRNNISRFGSRSAQASPVTVLSSQTSSAESSPPQSGKNDGRFPGSAGVIDQLMQQQILYSNSDGGPHSRQELSDHSIRTRRCLLRPISDPKIEEKLTSHIAEDYLSGMVTNPNSVHVPQPKQSGLASDAVVKPQVIEQTVKPNVSPTPSVKALVTDSTVSKKPDKKDQDEGELSRTPSPVGPFQYITDPLITGVEPKTVPAENKQPVVIASETEAKFKSLRFNAEVTNLEETKAKLTSQLGKTPNGFIESVLKSTSFKKDTVVASVILKDPAMNLVKQQSAESVNHPDDIPPLTKDSTTASCSSREETSLRNDEAFEDTQRNKSSENDMKKSFFKLRERLESLASSQSSIQGFEIFKNVTHTFGSLRNIKEKVDSENGGEALLESKVSPTPKSFNDSRQSSLDESSQVTLSDESVMSVEGTSSVSDDNDYKKTDEDEENPDSSSQNLTVRKAEGDKTMAATAGPSAVPLNVLTERSLSSQRQCQAKRCDSCTERCGSGLHKPSKASSLSDTELHLKKGGARCALRKRLRRSCVTIDEVECREFVSSEDTSPSSSVSLEWNDFDKIETDTCCCGGGILPIAESEPSIAICCDDVNVAETEIKFNIVDKEMCVFFETPSSSSIGKSASSSSNATDFSTTSDRFRGVMQREKSDDRSSKESDSDNLSKLSDVEGRSESAFSEDFARKTDFGSSSSSASVDVLDSVRAKLSNDGDCDSKQTSNWVLDNIDEIPDDDQCHVEDPATDKSPTASSSTTVWKPEKSMDFAQRRENFLSCAADCRDMYRISFDDKVKTNHGNETDNTQMVEAKEPLPIGMIMPDLAPGILELFPPSRKNPDENDAPTDILAAFVETISDITSAFGELYPRQGAKIEDVSSDESIGISTFERVLTSSSISAHTKSRLKKAADHQKEKSSTEDTSEKRFGNKKNTMNVRNNSESKCPDTQNFGPAFVKLPPENGPKLVPQSSTDDDSSSKDNSKCQDLDPNIPGHTTTNDRSTEKITNGSGHPAPHLRSAADRKIPDRLKILNRTSQSVCLDRVRQSSFEDDAQLTQSAPCSPRMKPRQRSVEEVMSSSRNELSRNSSLSQSTSQESLPGNETGGLMSYHRYYHVFRQGELDNLIETHVDNLHILSSYYDHANWCVVAEKVQVWTI